MDERFVSTYTDTTFNKLAAQAVKEFVCSNDASVDGLDFWTNGQEEEIDQLQCALCSYRRDATDGQNVSPRFLSVVLTSNESCRRSRMWVTPL